MYRNVEHIGNLLTVQLDLEQCTNLQFGWRQFRGTMAKRLEKIFVQITEVLLKERPAILLHQGAFDLSSYFGDKLCGIRRGIRKHFGLEVCDELGEDFLKDVPIPAKVAGYLGRSLKQII